MAFGIKLRVWGDYACFTRPEMKVERVSYDVITPSAAHGVRFFQPLSKKEPFAGKKEEKQGGEAKAVVVRRDCGRTADKLIPTGTE